ncbi:MAG: lipopolysaccharide biosynthesis protein [Ruminococcus sp.]|uniref:lipopolysaccharide biosynthesis protein n=1 Tax=Ruminococcus sp. TaxID=41978 RepID=UPI0025FF2472|nr:lipopolysaccharide biosynthesis protein [Ruminococcus sp.]MCR4795508.1 lipopolysaccharide biosynthesis protein [Ruminococcus sp.]
MAKNNERNLNVTIKNQDDKDEVIISVSSIMKQLKRFLALWLVIAIMAGIIAFVFSAIKTFSRKNPARALVSFSYSGIEKGLDPAGRKFDINSIKDPLVIERALTQLGIDLKYIENVRANISFDSKIPEDAYERLTTYKNIMENASSGNLAAAQAMLDVTYYPTQFAAYFDFGAAGFDRTEGVDILNTILKCYSDVFYEQYGYNEALGAAVKVQGYEDYDYAQQLDLFRTSLRTVRNYLSSLSNDDTTAFRSSITGYTFKDLSEYAKTVYSIDLDRISSYISVNNVTKDKDATIAYYDYRIENLNRDKDEYADRIVSINDSIALYKKDEITFFGENIDKQSTVHSDQYDALFKQKSTAEANLAQTKQDIKFFESRREALKNNKNSSKANIDKVEADIKRLNDKVSQIVDLTQKTADDYYENVQFAHAYNILVPASKSVAAGISEAIKDSVKLIIIIEALIFMIYIGIAFVSALTKDNKKRGKAAAASGNDDDDDDEELDLDEIADAVEEEAEKAEKSAQNSQKNVKKNRKK